MLSAIGLALRPFTLIRVRGIFTIASDQSAATETQVGALGVAVVSEQAASIGVTAVPTTPWYRIVCSQQRTAPRLSLPRGLKSSPDILYCRNFIKILRTELHHHLLMQLEQ